MFQTASYRCEHTEYHEHHNFTASQIHKFTNLRFTSLRLHKFTNSQIHDSQVYDFTTSHLASHISDLGSWLVIFGQLTHFTSSQLHDFTTPQLHNSTTLRLHHFTKIPQQMLGLFFIFSEEWFCTLRWVNQSVLFSWARGLRMHGFSFVWLSNVSWIF